MKYLVVVESPAKKQKIQKFLNTIDGHSFIVEASFGHISYFSNGLKSIDTLNNFKPTYSIIKTKSKVVKNLKDIYKTVDEVIIATDIDREGEAIGYHVAETLGLDISNTKRICFNEITQNAIVDAYNSSRHLDLDMFNAQQTRSILDLLIGFEISPLLWKSIKPKLSAGRCQSPALRLLYDREKEINDFKSNKLYQISSEFNIKEDITATYFKDIKDKDTILELLPILIKHQYKLDNVINKNSYNSAPPPYITSSIQQDASNKFSMSPKLTMSVLQSLYEKGRITYMRTDSLSISKEFNKSIKSYLNTNYPDMYQIHHFKSKVANAQEAHECIRPVSLEYELPDTFPENEKKLYNLIKNRVIASQMKKYCEKNYIYTLISTENEEYKFSFTLTEIIEMGYKKIYKNTIEDNKSLIETIEIGGIYTPLLIVANEKNTKPKSRYTEASLIKELEDRGIGRPSTFATIVNKLLQREYAFKETKNKSVDITLEKISIKPDEEIEISEKKSKSTSEKNKLFINDIGKIVCEYITKNFTKINSYDFTSEIEDDLDKIAIGENEWTDVITKVYTDFHDKVVELSKDSNLKTQKQKLTNKIGVNPNNNKNIYVYIGKYGPCIQEGEHGDSTEKPRYVSLSKDDGDIENITLDMALELLKYPFELGSYEDTKIFIKKGKFGLYLDYKSKKVSIDNPDIKLEDAIELLKEKNENNVIKEFSGLKVMNGKYGPYIKKGAKNIPIPKKHDPSKITKKTCDEIVKNYKPKKFTKKKN